MLRLDFGFGQVLGAILFYRPSVSCPVISVWVKVLATEPCHNPTVFVPIIFVWVKVFGAVQCYGYRLFFPVILVGIDQFGAVFGYSPTVLFPDELPHRIGGWGFPTLFTARFLSLHLPQLLHRSRMPSLRSRAETSKTNGASS